MQKIGFIGAYDKIDLMLYVAKILTVLGKRILIVDCTQKQKAKYVVPAITPTANYVTEFENIDVAIGFSSFEHLRQYLGIDDLNQSYDIVFVDTDSYDMFKRFELENSDINYFVTSFDVYDLKKGLEVLSELEEQIKVTKILFSKNMLPEEEQYLDFLSKDCNISWNEYKIYFTITMEDFSAIIENQRVEKIKFKNHNSKCKYNQSCLSYNKFHCHC